MNPKSKALLEDILQDAAPAELREALLSGMLRQVRQRRRARALSRAVVISVLLVCGPLALWRALVLAPEPPGRPALAVRTHQPASYHLVRSQPLAPTMCIETKSGIIPVLASVSGTVAVVETTPGAHLFHELTDEQLLALLGGRPAALVRYSPDQAEVVIPLSASAPVY